MICNNCPDEAVMFSCRKVFEVTLKFRLIMHFPLSLRKIDESIRSECFSNSSARTGSKPEDGNVVNLHLPNPVALVLPTFPSTW